MGRTGVGQEAVALQHALHVTEYTSIPAYEAMMMADAGLILIDHESYPSYSGYIDILFLWVGMATLDNLDTWGEWFNPSISPYHHEASTYEAPDPSVKLNINHKKF